MSICETFEGRATPPAPPGLLARARAGEGEARTELDERHHAEMARIADAIIGAMPRAIPPG